MVEHFRCLKSTIKIGDHFWFTTPKCVAVHWHCHRQWSQYLIIGPFPLYAEYKPNAVWIGVRWVYVFYRRWGKITMCRSTNRNLQKKDVDWLSCHSKYTDITRMLFTCSIHVETLLLKRISLTNLKATVKHNCLQNSKSFVLNIM